VKRQLCECTFCYAAGVKRRDRFRDTRFVSQGPSPTSGRGSQRIKTRAWPGTPRRRNRKSKDCLTGQAIPWRGSWPQSYNALDMHSVAQLIDAGNQLLDLSCPKSSQPAPRLPAIRINCNSMEIRPLTPPPWPLLAHLNEASREEGFQFLIPLENEFFSSKVRFDAAGKTLLGAFQDPLLTGVGGLTRDPYCADPHTGRVRHLYGLPQWRGRDIGASLLSEIKRHAQTYFNTLVLRTDTKTAAFSYELLGYERLVDRGTATHRRTLTTGVV
jgi:GNAT superfamily N-acetyltransferase